MYGKYNRERTNSYSYFSFPFPQTVIHLGVWGHGLFIFPSPHTESLLSGMTRMKDVFTVFNYIKRKLWQEELKGIYFELVLLQAETILLWPTSSTGNRKISVINKPKMFFSIDMHRTITSRTFIPVVL